VRIRLVAESAGVVAGGEDRNSTPKRFGAKGAGGGIVGAGEWDAVGSWCHGAIIAPICMGGGNRFRLFVLRGDFRQEQADALGHLQRVVGFVVAHIAVGHQHVDHRRIDGHPVHRLVVPDPLAVAAQGEAGALASVGLVQHHLVILAAAVGGGKRFCEIDFGELFPRGVCEKLLRQCGTRRTRPNSYFVRLEANF